MKNTLILICIAIIAILTIYTFRKKIKLETILNYFIYVLCLLVQKFFALSGEHKKNLVVIILFNFFCILNKKLNFVKIPSDEELAEMVQKIYNKYENEIKDAEKYVIQIIEDKEMAIKTIKEIENYGGN